VYVAARHGYSEDACGSVSRPRLNATEVPQRLRAPDRTGPFFCSENLRLSLLMTKVRRRAHSFIEILLDTSERVISWGRQPVDPTDEREGLCAGQPKTNRGLDVFDFFVIDVSHHRLSEHFEIRRLLLAANLDEPRPQTFFVEDHAYFDEARVGVTNGIEPTVSDNTVVPTRTPISLAWHSTTVSTSRRIGSFK
jgi:hypothetical protein